MKSYAEWKLEQKNKILKESAENEVDEIKTSFDDLRETIRRVSESAGFFGSIKRGVFNATKGVASSLFGKDSHAANAVPDVSSNYDLHRKSTLGTIGRTAVGGMRDAAGRIADEITGAARERRRSRMEGADAEGNLYLEWDKNALEVIMAKIDEVEKKISKHVGIVKSSSGTIQSDDFSNSGHSFSTHTGIPSGIAHTLQSQLPPASFDKMEEKFETDPLLQKFLAALGKKAPFTAINQIASEMGQTPEDLADELDNKYVADGALKSILLKRRPIGGKIADHLKGYGHKIVRPREETPPGLNKSSGMSR
jgi:hypothetical protein